LVTIGKVIFDPKLTEMKVHVPNALTCANLFCGCVAAVMIFRNQLNIAAYLVFIAAFFDLLDGMVARKVASDSEYGKQLDSLADMISFGFVPGAVIFKLLQMSDIHGYFNMPGLTRFLQFAPFIITIFSALRLVKFNLDKRQTSSFIGLPTPANTLFIISLPLILNQFPGTYDLIILNPITLLGLTVVCSFLLVSEIPLFSMKFKSAAIKDNIYQYILIAVAILLLPFILFAAIPVLVFLYIFLSLIQNYSKTRTQ
jgi:CDP-diacylglycerol--serine O-phosphatidyltransferase